MMFSDDRKFTLSGWLQVHEKKVYDRDPINYRFFYCYTNLFQK